MNAREHLMHIIESGFPDDPRDGEECRPALRELDHLLSDSMKLIESMGMLTIDGDANKLWKRLAQAGYGDK